MLFPQPLQALQRSVTPPKAGPLPAARAARQVQSPAATDSQAAARAKAQARAYERMHAPGTKRATVEPAMSNAEPVSPYMNIWDRRRATLSLPQQLGNRRALSNSTPELSGSSSNQVAGKSVLTSIRRMSLSTLGALDDSRRIPSLHFMALPSSPPSPSRRVKFFTPSLCRRWRCRSPYTAAAIPAAAAHEQ